VEFGEVEHLKIQVDEPAKTYAAVASKGRE
jgi:hypothetical protein